MTIVVSSFQINSSLEKPTGCVSELSSLYHRAAADPEAGQGQENAAFLSQLPLEDYHKMEEKFTQELTSFTKKQFFEVKRYSKPYKYNNFNSSYMLSMDFCLQELGYS